MEINANSVLDAKGLACPMPVVRTKKAMKTVGPGQVLEVQATDQGTKADLKAWAESAGHQYLGTLEEGAILKHYIRKSTEEEKGEINYPHIASNESLAEKLAAEENIVLIDVREAAEYAFNHIPKAINIPLGDLEERASELNKDDEIYIVCRTGNRSDFAAQKLTALGFSNVKNVVPGMSGWDGSTKNSNEQGGN